MKIPLISGIDVIKRLKKAGFIATRQKGSHVRLEKSISDTTIKITVLSLTTGMDTLPAGSLMNGN